MKGRTWTEVVWGIRYIGDPRYKDGYVESGGIDPGGNIVARFSEDVATYIAKTSQYGTLVRKVVVHSETHFDWETV